MLKVLDEENVLAVTELLNNWWEEEKVANKQLEARVVMIFLNGRCEQIRTL